MRIWQDDKVVGEVEALGPVGDQEDAAVSGPGEDGFQEPAPPTPDVEAPIPALDPPAAS